MSKPMSYAGQKRLIQLSKEQEERMAQQSVQKIQAFVNEANNIQSRRCEVAIALLSAGITHGGLEGLDAISIAKYREVARVFVEQDANEKFADLKRLFVELDIKGPQPHLEWAAKQVGVTLFDESEEEAQLIQPATAQEVTRVIQ